MWIIENENFQNGGLVEYNKKYRLRHFSSGYYLSVDIMKEVTKYLLYA